jgi:hypothetical protein
MSFAIGLFTTLGDVTRVKGGNAFSSPQSAKDRIKPSRKVHSPIELMPNALFRVSSVSISKQVQKVMSYRQHHPFFKDPSQKLSLRFGHFTNLVYTCMDGAYGFVKGGFTLFHTKYYRLFSSLSPPWG